MLGSLGRLVAEARGQGISPVLDLNRSPNRPPAPVSAVPYSASGPIVREMNVRYLGGPVRNRTVANPPDAVATDAEVAVRVARAIVRALIGRLGTGFSELPAPPSESRVPHVLNKRHLRGPLPSSAIFCGRPQPLGNRFIIGRGHARCATSTRSVCPPNPTSCRASGC
jgi:hypothetical protein